MSAEAGQALRLLQVCRRQADGTLQPGQVVLQDGPDEFRVKFEVVISERLRSGPDSGIMPLPAQNSNLLVWDSTVIHGRAHERVGPRARQGLAHPLDTRAVCALNTAVDGPPRRQSRRPGCPGPHRIQHRVAVFPAAIMITVIIWQTGQLLSSSMIPTAPRMVQTTLVPIVIPTTTAKQHPRLLLITLLPAAVQQPVQPVIPIRYRMLVMEILTIPFMTAVQEPVLSRVPVPAVRPAMTQLRQDRTAII